MESIHIIREVEPQTKETIIAYQLFLYDQKQIAIIGRYISMGIYSNIDDVEREKENYPPPDGYRYRTFEIKLPV